MEIRRHLASAAVLLVATSTGAVIATSTPAHSHATTTAAADEGDGYGRMILLLDSSGSMAEPAGGGQTKIAAARKALTTVVDGLPDEAQVGLRVFGAKVFSRDDPGSCTDSQLVVEPGTDNRDELSAAIGDYEPYGETPIPHALQEAAKDLGDEGARSIVLVSDGESTCDPDPCEVAADLQGKGIDLQIDVVGLSVSGAAREQLKCIAEQGNGTYYDANSAADIESRLTRVASRAIRPFSLSGLPIVGGPESSPTPVEVGEYTDTLGPGGESKSYVFTRETAGTTLRVAALSQGERGFNDGLTAEITGPGGRCDVAIARRFLDLREVMGVQVSAGADTEASAEDCAEPGDYVITVTRGLGAVEKGVPYGLVVTEEPLVEDVGFVDAVGADVTAPQVGGPATAVEGGASFANATEVGSGSWSSTVVPGESVLFKVPLEFGQSAKISAVFPKASGGLAEKFGRFPPNVHLGLYNPLGAQLGYGDGSTWLGNPDDETLLTATRAVSRQPSDARSEEFNGGADYTTAGDYYLTVSVQREDYTVEIPFTLNVEVIGEPADGPTYADGATWSVADGTTGGDDGGSTETPSASESAEPEIPAAEDEAAEDDGGSTGVVGVAAGVLGLGALLAALVLWRRRRADSGPSAP